MSRNIVETNNLTRHYGNIKAVKGLGFAVQQGEFFGFLGPNGAGKTTTLSMLACILEPSEGTALIAGHDLINEPNEVRQIIGLVPQELALYPTLNAFDNLLYFGSIYGLRGRALRRRIIEVLGMVSLSDYSRKPVKAYSGGMKRRLNIAAGLLHSPRLLFLDEPTAGVDPQSRNAIFDHVERLKEEGMTIIYTTHYMEEAERLCDRVAIIDEGRIIALDAPHKLIADLGGGIIHLGVGQKIIDKTMLKQIRSLPQIKSAERLNGKYEIKTSHTKETLIHLLDFFKHTTVSITSLEILEPNLETVFLSLTGKQLRD